MPERPGSPLAQDLVLYALAATAGALAIGSAGWLHSIGQTSLLLWWASAVLAGLLLRFGPRLALAMWCGAMLAQLLLGARPAMAFMNASGLVSGPLLLALWQRRAGWSAASLLPRDVLRFALATAVTMTLPPFLTWLGMSVLQFVPGPPRALARLPQWWAHGSIAVLLIAPAVATVSRATLEAWRREPTPLLEALLALVVLLSANLALPDDLLRVTTLPFALLLAVYVAQRTDPVFGSLYCLAVVMSIILRTEPGGGGFFYALIVAATTLLVRSMFAERRRMQQLLLADELAYRAELLQAAARERRRIGRDVHDTIGQELTAVALLARLVESRAQALAPALGADAAAVRQACERATRSARAVSRQLLSDGAAGGGTGAAP